MLKRNRSKTYLLPLLSEFVQFDMKFMKFLHNTYMFIDDENYKECFCILHEFSFKDPSFTKYEKRLLDNNLFVKHIDINNNVLYIFKFPEEYMFEYYCLLEGKYSEFGEDAKKLILKFWADVYRNNSNAVQFLIDVKNVLYKEEKLRQIIEKKLGVKIDKSQELGEIINIEEETFKLDIYAK